MEDRSVFGEENVTHDVRVFIYLYYVEDATDTFGNVTYKVGDVTDY